MESQRSYRFLHNNAKLNFFNVKYQETDLHIGVDNNSFNQAMRRVALERVISLRKEILLYNQFVNPSFLKSFHALAFDKDAPEMVKVLLKSSLKAGIGPMSAVAGAFAEILAKELKREFKLNEIVIENGGDIFIQCKTGRLLALYAGKSIFSNKLGIKIPSSSQGLGIATSAGTVGHSYSSGKADALTIVCKSAAQADAYATAFANKVKKAEDIEDVLNEIKQINDILGIIIVKNDSVGCFGNIEMVSLKKHTI